MFQHNVPHSISECVCSCNLERYSVMSHVTHHKTRSHARTRMRITKTVNSLYLKGSSSQCENVFIRCRKFQHDKYIHGNATMVLPWYNMVYQNKQRYIVLIFGADFLCIIIFL